jgi:hypothetical protein
MEKQNVQPQPLVNVQPSLLARRSMLVALNISMFGGTMQDKSITDEVHETHGVKSGAKAGAYKKKLLTEAVKKINRFANAARGVHYFMTMPYSRDGYAILPVGLYETYTREMDSYRNQMYDAIDEVVRDWHEYIEKDRQRLNGLFDPSDYPHPSRFKELFTFRIAFEPVPDSGSWLVDMEREELSKLQSRLESSIQQEFVNAHMANWQRLFEVVEHLVNVLDEYGKPIKGTDRTKTFRDSAVTNITELLGILPQLNIVGDANLEAITNRIAKKIAQADPEILRADKKQRAEILKEAREIMADMSFYMG